MDKAQQGKETKEAILSACLRLFARQGFEGTSMDEIARMARITKGAVYWHFPGKNALFDAILERIRASWQEKVLRTVNTGTTPTERLEHLFDGYVELFTQDPDRCLFLQRILLGDDATFAPQVARLFRQTARFIAGILEDGQECGQFSREIEPLLTAHTILGGLSGASQQWLANNAMPLTALIREVKTAALARVRA
jgi:AcrR family transcriptional regulator